MPSQSVVQGLVEGDLALQVGRLAQMHQYFVLNAPGGVGGQLDVFCGLIGIDGLDEADGADGNQILNAHAGIFKAAGDVDHQRRFRSMSWDFTPSSPPSRRAISSASSSLDRGGGRCRSPDIHDPSPAA